MLAVFEKEFKGYFRSSIGTVFIGLFLLVSAGIFYFAFLINGVIAYTQYLYYLNLVLMITVPILTMKVFSEERKTKTDQLLLTCPLKASDIVLGKYFAAVAILFITLLIHSLDAIIISFYAVNMYFFDTMIAYVGLFLVGCAYIAIGEFVSSTTDSQVISAIITFVILLVIYLLQSLSTSITSSVLSGVITCAVIAIGVTALIFFTTRNKIATLCTFSVLAIVIAVLAVINSDIFAGLLYTMLTWLSLLERFSEFLNGSVSLSSFVYLISFSFVFVYMTVYQIEKRRWIG